MSRLHLALLGAPQVALDGRAISFPTRKALALLIYLALENGAHTRAQLAALFWPGSDTPHGRLSLRRALGQVRDTLGERAPESAVLRADTEIVQFVAHDATFDLDLLRAQATRSAVEAALTAYRGDFLDGFALPDAPDFDTWAGTERERWHRQLALLLARASAAALAGGDTAFAIAAAQRWAAHDPLDEAAHRRLIEAHAASGSRTLALHAYDALRALLARDLGVAPAAETDALLARVRHAPEPSAAPPAPRSAPAQLPDLPLVGRVSELGSLIDAFRALEAGGACVIAIQGEAGIGKTRLATEFGHWARAAGADVLQGRAFEAGGRVPYQPLVDALRPRLDRENAPDDLLDDVWLAELARLLPELRGRYPDLAPADADESTARVRLFESVVALCASLSTRAPCVWAVDDAQWADAASLDLLRYCVRRLAEQRKPLLVVCTIRAEDLLANAALTAWLAGLERDGGLLRIELAPLSGNDTHGLLAAFANRSGGEAERFAGWLFAETGGQPLYMVETLKVLLDRGVLALETRAGEPPRLALANDLAALRGLVPPTVRAIIRTRIGQLSPDAQTFLAAAAVLGHASGFEQIARVAGLPEPASLDALDEALARRLLVEQAAQPGQRSPARYTISHDKIRDVVYTEAGDARRRIYHQRAFAALASAPPAERAHHALAGGLTSEACTCSILAGDEALQLFAIDDALAAYQQARSLLGAQASGAGTAAEQVPHLFLQLGRAYELLSALDQAAAMYEELRMLARESNWPAAEGAALNRLATLKAQRALDMAAAIDLLHQAQALAEHNGIAADLAETEWNLAQLHFYNSQPALTLQHGQRALHLAREHDLPELAARSLNVLALAWSALARPADSQRAAEEASAHYQRLGNRALEADSVTLAGSMQINQGKVQAGLGQARAAYALNQAIGNVWGMASSAMTLAGGLCDAGHLGEALASAAEAVQLVRERPLTMLQILTLGVLGATQRATLQLEAARATHEEAWALVVPTGARLLIDMIAAELCADCVFAGDMPAAAGYARAGLDVRDYIFTLYMGRAQWQQTAALVWAGEAERARDDLQQFAERIGEQPRYQLGFWCAQAELARHAGDTAGAIAAFERALGAADSLKLPGEQWPILVALARLRAARGDIEPANEARARAAALIQRLAAAIDDAEGRAAFLREAGKARS